MPINWKKIHSGIYPANRDMYIYQVGRMRMLVTMSEISEDTPIIDVAREFGWAYRLLLKIARKRGPQMPFGYIFSYGKLDEEYYKALDEFIARQAEFETFEESEFEL